MFNKLKSWLLDDTLYIAVLLVLVGIASFGLGRMSVLQDGVEKATVGQTGVLQANTIMAVKSASTSTATATSSALSIAKVTQAEVGPLQKFVASKSGSKYHAPNCPGAKQIKDTNKIYFESESEAEAAGYTRAANCKF